MDSCAAADIRDAVNRSIGTDPVADAIVTEAIVADLLARYGEQHRRYHTAEHVMWVLRHVGRLCDVARSNGIDVDRDTIDLAALFHDAIYDPRSGSNEADSAELAAAHLRRVGWSTARIAAVEQLILATAGHAANDRAANDHAANDHAEAILLDADLAILGAAPDEYSQYAADVRAEYAFVDDDHWRIGRREVLMTFLDRAQIFGTQTMASEREDRARSNLSAELATLRSGTA